MCGIVYVIAGMKLMLLQIHRMLGTLDHVDVYENNCDMPDGSIFLVRHLASYLLRVLHLWIMVRQNGIASANVVLAKWLMGIN